MFNQFTGSDSVKGIDASFIFPAYQLPRGPDLTDTATVPLARDAYKIFLVFRVTQILKQGINASKRKCPNFLKCPSELSKSYY